MSILRDWLPAGAAVCAVVVSSGYAISRFSHASTRIHEVKRLGDGLCSISQRAQADFVDPAAAKAAQQENEDLLRRMEEATRPALVQAALMAAAHQAGLTIEEVIPMLPAQAGQGSAIGKSSVKYPGYRVMVQGSYSQVADFMQLCRTQRVPMRTISFRITSSLDQKGRPTSGLKAEISVESFISNSPPAVGGKP
jgi:hypothetical protein